jgi:diguanylate cyclase (GGDEF)-like protein
MVIGGARVGDIHPLTHDRTVVGRSPEAQIRLRDDGISRAHAELLVEDGRVRVRDLGSTNGTFLNGERADARELRDGDKLSVGEATLLLFTHQEGIEPAYQRGRFLTAVRDPATAALKREVFVERLAQEVSFARRHGAPLSLLVWELDGFGGLAARLGEEGTRRCLAAIARAAGGGLVEGDVLGVVEPGRFAIACRDADGASAGERAARLRADVAQTRFDGGAPHAPLTASVGVATCGPGKERTTEAAEALLRAASVALGAARARGGDRVAFSEAAVSS